MVSGKMRVNIGEETFEASPGNFWNIPDGVPHSADILEDSVAVEVFCSRRTSISGKPAAGLQVNFCFYLSCNNTYLFIQSPGQMCRMEGLIEVEYFK